MIIRCRAPLRLGLAGGGTDVSPFSDLYGGYTLNATIDKYVYATLQTPEDDKVVFTSGDIGQSENHQVSTSFALEGPLILHRAVYNYFVKNHNNSAPFPIEAHTLAEAPAGSGLGTSSTIVVALCKAYADYLNIPLDDYAIARVAWEIERQHCQLAGGKQDQYAAAFGGVNFMEFQPGGRVIVTPLRIKKWILTEFESSLLLYFTGASRDSDKIIRAQSENVVNSDQTALNAMRELKKEAIVMKESLLSGDFTNLISSFQKGWESKKRMAKAITNSQIETLYEAAMDAGAEAAKISGAGGGGFMMFFVRPAHRMRVVNELKNIGGEMYPAHFTKDGAQSWRM